MAKLSRKQIREGLEQIPIDSVLLGVNSPVSKLTAKQKEFARLVAMGETKSGAYRGAYNSTGKPHTVAVVGHKLASRADIQMTIDAYKMAHEAARYRTPIQLRELVIHQLTQHALNTDCPPAQRIKALELLGKVSEVAAFTDRKETVVVNQSRDIRTKLIESLRNVVDVEDVTVKDEDADGLLAELSGLGGALVEPIQQPHPAPTTLSEPPDGLCSIHTTPHEQFPPESTPDEPPHRLSPEQIKPIDKNSPDDDPTPSIWEDPPIGDQNEDAGGDIFSENPDDANLRQT